MEDRKFFASVVVCILAYLSTVLGITAVSTSYWAEFYKSNPPHRDEYEGHFGPWNICKSNNGFNRESCGEQFTRFYVSRWVVIAGVFSAVGVALIGDICILAPLHMVMLCTKQKVLVSYKHAVVAKMWLAAIGSFISALSVLFFCMQRDSRDLGYAVRKAWSFYLEVTVVCLNCLLVLACGAELYMLRQLGGDPTKYAKDPEGAKANTIINPGYREDANRRRVSRTSSVVSTILSASAPSSSRSSQRRRSNGSSATTSSGGTHNHAGHNHRRRSRSSSVSSGRSRRGSSSRSSRRRRRPRSHSMSRADAGALPHQVGPDGQIITGSNLSLNHIGYRVPPPLTMLPLKSSLKKKRGIVPGGKLDVPVPMLDTSDASCSIQLGTLNNNNNTASSGMADESVASWTSSDVPGLTIPNPHFSPDSAPSPQPSCSSSSFVRNGSIKKVRIQTRSTDV